jgi:hypothetical protein
MVLSSCGQTARGSYGKLPQSLETIGHSAVQRREALLAERFTTPEILVERYAAVARSGLELAARRVQAVQDYWAEAPHLREPMDLFALQSAFWRRALDDYGAVMTQAIRPLEQPKAVPSRGLARAA